MRQDLAVNRTTLPTLKSGCLLLADAFRQMYRFSIRLSDLIGALKLTDDYGKYQ